MEPIATDLRRLVVVFLLACWGCAGVFGQALPSDDEPPPLQNGSTASPPGSPHVSVTEATLAATEVTGATGHSADCPLAAGGGAPETTTCCCGHCVDWSKIPQSIRPMPRTGNFPILPTDPGYYSLWDYLTGTYREKAPPSGYVPFAVMPPSFFDADFRYVESLDPGERTLVESLKRMHLNDCWMFSTGGQFWTRYMDENNSRLTTIDNDYTLTRLRLFGDLSFSDKVRIFGEYLHADTFGEELPVNLTDQNFGDIQNLFIEAPIAGCDCHPLFLRVGRQELLLGSQRLVSTLDWVNTRRTFDGARLLRQGEKWDFDLFWTQFVPPRASELDRYDENRDFAGAWLTYRAQKGRFLDFYYLYADNSNRLRAAEMDLAPFSANTLGTRWTGDKDGFLWDSEFALQLGSRAGADLVAGAATAGVGRNWRNASMNPTLWLYYDYASGDSDPGSGQSTTFNQLYPFGHYYLGWIDLVGRQNIHDLNVHLFLYPANWITFFCQYHNFWLASSRDALYGANGAPLRRDPTGQAGNEVGQELDFVLNFHLARYSDLLVGYSKLYGGNFLEQTSGPDTAADSEFFHAMFQQRW